MSLLTVLEELGNKINTRYEYVNGGGCAIVACALVKSLRKHPEVTNVQVVAHRHTGRHYDAGKIRNNKGFSNTWSYWRKYSVNNHHILAKFTYEGATYLVDSNQVIRFKRDSRKLSLNLPLKEFTELADSSESWNPMFNRDQIRGIRSMITRSINNEIKAMI